MNNTCPPLTEFDQLTLGNSTQIIKAILPYFDFQTQRMVSLIIRIQELKATINFYRNHTEAACAKGWASGFSQQDLFQIIKKIYPDFNFDMINSFNTFMQMENMMSSNSKNDESDNFNMAHNMMNPTQQQCYEEFLKDLEKIDFESEEKYE